MLLQPARLKSALVGKTGEIRSYAIGRDNKRLNLSCDLLRDGNIPDQIVSLGPDGAALQRCLIGSGTLSLLESNSNLFTRAGQVTHINGGSADPELAPGSVGTSAMRQCGATA